MKQDLIQDQNTMKYMCQRSGSGLFFTQLYAIESSQTTQINMKTAIIKHTNVFWSKFENNSYYFSITLFALFAWLVFLETVKSKQALKLAHMLV